MHPMAAVILSQVVGNGTLGVPALYVLGDGYRASRRIWCVTSARRLSVAVFTCLPHTVIRTIPLIAGVHATRSDGVQAAMLSSGPSSAVWHLQGAEHGNFVDAAFWAPLWVMRNLPFIPAAGQKSPAEVHDELARSAFDFVVKNAAPKGSAGSVQAMLERLTG